MISIFAGLILIFAVVAAVFFIELAILIVYRNKPKFYVQYKLGDRSQNMTYGEARIFARQFGGKIYLEF